MMILSVFSRLRPLAVICLLATGACETLGKDGGDPNTLTPTTMKPSPTVTDSNKTVDPVVQTGNETIHMIGRFTADTAPAFAWPGTTLSTSFMGTGLSVNIVEATNQKSYNGTPAGNIYTVSIDGNTPTLLQATAGGGTYRLASGLSNATHTATLVKRTESSVGTARFGGFTVTGGQLVASPRNNAHRMLVIGDSISAGYGALGANPNCSFSPKTQDASVSYGALTAKALNAELNIVAYSGKGLYRNADGSTTSTMSDMFQLTLPDNAGSAYDLTTFAPQVIAINLGTNDFNSNNGLPDNDLFQAAYLKMIASLQVAAPNAEIFLILGPMLTDVYPVGMQVLSTARTAIQGVVSQSGSSKVHFLEFTTLTTPEQACDFHPSAAAHVRMAASLTAAVKQITGW